MNATAICGKELLLQRAPPLHQPGLMATPALDEGEPSGILVACRREYWKR